jgi:hypothetical protein
MSQTGHFLFFCLLFKSLKVTAKIQYKTAIFASLGKHDATRCVLLYNTQNRQQAQDQI